VHAHLLTVERGDHGWGGNAQDWLRANDEMIEFFDRGLKRDLPPP
jgi:hypothetical protein